MFKIGIDIGYGYVKGINERGQRVKFRSLIAPAYDRRLEGIFGAQEDETDIHVEIMQPDGSINEYFVGDLALKSHHSSYAFDRNKINHPATQVLLAVAASQLTRNAYRPIHLITGLPLDHYLEQKDSFKEKLENTTIKIKHLSGADKGKQAHFSFDRVTIFVQGGASIYSYLLDERGLPYKTEFMNSGELIAAINIGFNTIDVAVFEAGKILRLRPDLSFTIDGKGMINIRLAVQEAIFAQTNARPDIAKIETIIEKGRGYFRGKELNINEDIEKAKKMIATTIENEISTRWKESIDNIGMLYLCGGGALELKGLLNNLHSRIETSSDSQFADAIGYLNIGRMKELEGNGFGK